MEHRKVLKGIGSVFLSPQRRNNTWAAVWTWGVLSESSHVCPPDWLSCIWGGFKTLFLITFKCSVFSELPLCNKGPRRALMIGVNSIQRKLLVEKKLGTCLGSHIITITPTPHPLRLLYYYFLTITFISAWIPRYGQNMFVTIQNKTTFVLKVDSESTMFRAVSHSSCRDSHTVFWLKKKTSESFLLVEYFPHWKKSERTEQSRGNMENLTERDKAKAAGRFYSGYFHTFASFSHHSVFK